MDSFSFHIPVGDIGVEAESSARYALSARYDDGTHGTTDTYEAAETSEAAGDLELFDAAADAEKKFEDDPKYSKEERKLFWAARALYNATLAEFHKGYDFTGQQATYSEELGVSVWNNSMKQAKHIRECLGKEKWARFRQSPREHKMAVELTRGSVKPDGSVDILFSFRATNTTYAKINSSKRIPIFSIKDELAAEGFQQLSRLRPR